jgi:hypothetical protein
MRNPIALITVLLLTTMPGIASAAPKGVGEMTREEVRDEVHRLYRDDLSYARYIKRLIDAADAKWPTLSDAKKTEYQIYVYARLMDALRLLKGETAFPPDAAGRRYQAAVSISLAIDGSKLAEEYQEFYKDVFNSEEFNASSSAYKETVIDLWTRYERTKKVVPYTDLLHLNQARMGRPDGQDGDGIRSHIATMYAELGDHVVEAKWYEGVSPAGLGPLKSADALFAAKRYGEAAEKYRKVLAELEAWVKLKPRLKETAVAEPLQFADLNAIKEKAEARLKESKQRQANSSTTKSSS